MKLRRAIGTGVITVLFGMLVAALPAYAQTTVTDARCTVAASRIATYATEIQTLRESHLTTYEGIINQGDTIIASSEQNGYDTTKLTAAQEGTQAAIDTYTTNATNFETALASLQGYACGENGEQFTNALATARTTLTSLRTSSAAVKASVIDDLIPEIKAYAAWLGIQGRISDVTTEDQP